MKYNICIEEECRIYNCRGSYQKNKKKVANLNRHLSKDDLFCIHCTKACEECSRSTFDTDSKSDQKWRCQICYTVWCRHTSPLYVRSIPLAGLKMHCYTCLLKRLRIYTDRYDNRRI